MNRSIFVFAIAIVCSLLLSFYLSAAANENPQTDLKEEVVVDLVDLFFTATDSKGNFVTDLRQDEMKVEEDGVVQSIQSFAAIPGERRDVPLNLAVMIDNSGSMAEDIDGVLKIDLAREAGLSMLQQLGPLDRMMIITFDEEPKVIPLTSDQTLLQDSLHHLRVHFGYTALFNSILTTLDQLNEQAGRKVLLLISDGNDNLSQAKIDEVVNKMANSPDLTVVILGTVATTTKGVPYDKTFVNDKGKTILQRMADSTAGYAFFPKNLKELQRVQELIRSFVRSQYSLVYRPVNRKFDGKYRRIRLTCSRKNVQLHYRQGYYDTP
jgi:VWFA-related protein